MSDQTFVDLENVQRTAGAVATLEHLSNALRSDKRFHDLFDALLLKKRHELGLSLTRATLDDVPTSKYEAFQTAYLAAAKEVGELLLAEGNIRDAWMYLKPVKETKQVAAAIEKLTPEQADEDVINIAFFQGVAPIAGVKMLLASHGTCSTITSFDQQIMNMAPADRKGCAAILVSELYKQLRDSLEHEVRRRQPMIQPGQSIRELIAGREELFAEDAYHIDVSHLNGVVRFARSLESDSPELKLAIQLAQYGSKLSTQYQYASNPPFDDFYPSHIQFFRVLQGDGREEGLKFFREKLGEDVNDQANQMTAFVLVDLMQRVGRQDEALDLACKYLARSADEFGLSIAEMCSAAGQYDRLLQMAREQGDVITFTTALLSRPA